MPTITATSNASSTLGTTLVIGATGTTGSRVVSRLVAAGHRVRAAGRRATGASGSVRFDWDEPATFDAALDGVDRAYLIPPVGVPDPASVMLPFLERGRAATLRRAVLLSASAIPAGGPAVGQVHQVLPDLFDEWAVLRPSWFMQNFTGDHPHARGIRSNGVLLTATGGGRVAFVDADDIAAVAVRALTDAPAPNSDLVITGPEALAYDEIAAVLSQVMGRTVLHRRLTPDRMRERMATEMPAEYATMLADMDHAIAHGAEDRTTDTVRRMTGHAPRTFGAFARREFAARS